MILGNVPKGSQRDCQLKSLGMAGSGHQSEKGRIKKQKSNVFPPLNSQPNAKGSLDTKHGQEGMPGHVKAKLGLSLSSRQQRRCLALGKNPQGGRVVCLQGYAASLFLCSDPAIPTPSVHEKGHLGEGQALLSGSWVPSPGGQGRSLRGTLGVCSYQVWRGGLGLRPVIIHVQIDQDFGCSPYSAGHFPYRQLPESRGRGDRDKARPVSTEKESREGLDVRQGSTPTCKQHPVTCDR